ncbi:hypothetical protein Hanom_Chr13g01223971 [Helianthus anomalus]
MFIYVRECSVTCWFMFDSPLVFLVFIFYLITSKFRQIKYLMSVSVLYILFMNVCLCSFVSICVQWRSLTCSTGGSKTYIPKNFCRTGGLKTYIPKHLYTKTTYITLLSEKFGGSGAPPGPFKASPMFVFMNVRFSFVA